MSTSPAISSSPAADRQAAPGRGRLALQIGAYLAGMVVVAGAYLMHSASSAENGEVPGLPAAVSGSLDLKVGECVTDPWVWQRSPGAAGSLRSHTAIGVVACSDRHDAQVYASAALSGTRWPGETGVRRAADALCRAQFDDFVQVPYEESVLQYAWYAPTQQGWAAESFHVVNCVVLDGGGPVRGTLEAARR